MTDSAINSTATKEKINCDKSASDEIKVDPKLVQFEQLIYKTWCEFLGDLPRLSAAHILSAEKLAELSKGLKGRELIRQLKNKNSCLLDHIPWEQVARDRQGRRYFEIFGLVQPRFQQVLTDYPMSTTQTAQAAQAPTMPSTQNKLPIPTADQIDEFNDRLNLGRLENAGLHDLVQNDALTKLASNPDFMMSAMSMVMNGSFKMPDENSQLMGLMESVIQEANLTDAASGMGVDGLAGVIQRVQTVIEGKVAKGEVNLDQIKNETDQYTKQFASQPQFGKMMKQLDKHLQ